MVTYRATYTLTRTDGKTEYISRPFKSKKEAKEDLYDELERLEKDGVLESLTYCNILEESQEPKEESKLFTLWGEPADEELRETYRKKLNKKLDKLYKKRMKLDDKIEAVREEVLPLKKEEEQVSNLVKSLYGTLHYDNSIIVNKAYEFYKFLMKQESLHPLSFQEYVNALKKLKEESKLFSSVTFKKSSISILF